MRALKVTLEGVITSFRYPNFMLGVQPTYDMPPPATIYGHICSAVGDWVPPEGLQFAYHFTHAGKLRDLEHVHVLATSNRRFCRRQRGKLRDLEHVHVLAPSSGKLPGTRLPKALEGKINPFQRELLFQPRLTLYINRPEWEGAFRSPRYPVVLGRSQDLCSYTDVRVVELVESPKAYFEHTLIPFDHPWRPAQGVVVTMPRWLDYRSNRRPTFARYIVLRQRVMSDDAQALQFGDPPRAYWTDPESPEFHGARMGLIFHTLV